MKVLLIEDDDLLIRSLTKSLILHRYVLDVAKDGEMGWSYGSTFEYDLVILETKLPKLDGISVCKRFRAEGFTTPIVLLSSRNEVTAKVQGLDAGADDYIVKPFEQAELFARIRALLRRSSHNPLPILAWGDLLLNLSTYEVSYNGQPLTLSTMEYELLELLLRDSQHVFSTDEIIDRLWPLEQFPSEATVRSHIRRVRQKLSASGAPKDFIATVHGRGYYLQAPKVEEPTVFSSTAASESLQFSEVESFLDGSRGNKAQLINQCYPLTLMLVSSDSEVNQSLMKVAEDYGIQLLIVPILPEESVLALLESNSELMTQYPQAILLRLPAGLDKEAIYDNPTIYNESEIYNESKHRFREFLELWRTLERCYPDVPILVMAERGELSDRIEALRRGSQLFLDAQLRPEQIIEAVVQFLERFNISSKVMVVDDDQDWLYSVTTLLKPWGFKVTTLTDLQQFWTVLKAVMPDALVLDIHLSQISGLEICQLLRSDPYWCRLPILFLSTATDSASQRQAFQAGADDYLHKPILGCELADRILNRLRRGR
jgi:DNA-binding response OmpR family regulator